MPIKFENKSVAKPSGGHTPVITFTPDFNVDKSTGEILELAKDAVIKPTLVVKGEGVKYPDGAKESKVDYTPGVSAQQVCHVGFKAAKTTNVGNFENVKVEVFISLPCIYAHIDTAYEEARAWVDKRMLDLSAEIDAAITTNKKG